MMQPTKSMPLMCQPDVATRRQCRSQRKEALHREAYAQWMSLWPLTPSQAVRRKRRWNLANSNKLTVFSLSTVGGNTDHMFLYSASIWCQALVVPSIRENTCVWMSVCFPQRRSSEPWQPADGFIVQYVGGFCCYQQGEIWNCKQRQKEVRFVLPVRRLTSVVWSEKREEVYYKYVDVEYM